MLAANTPRPRRRLVSIQAQLLLGAALILFLALAVALAGYLSLRALQRSAQTTLEAASRVRELSLQAHNEFLTARKNEAAFLTGWRTLGFEAASSEYVPANHAHLVSAQQTLDELKALAQAAGDPALQPIASEIDQLKPLLDDYESAFQATVAKVQERTRVGGLESALDRVWSELEADVSPLANPAFRQLALEMRVSEQAYLYTGRQEYIDNIRLRTQEFGALVHSSEPSSLAPEGGEALAEDLYERVVAYQEIFARLVALDRDIQINTTIFREVTDDINQITDLVGQESAAGLARAQEQFQTASEQAALILVLTGVLALGFGILSAVLVARRIVPPLQRLSQAAGEMGRGSLEQSVPASGARELVVLAETFNSMASRLRQTLGTLEHRVAERTRNLEAAAEVARATTELLDPDTLLQQVVDLVRTRFDLYYVGLFLLDEERRHAVLRAGTGEAGQQMLAQAHKLVMGGESMIGYCVASGLPGIALDVGEEPHRFDNPLLPDTRSEMALPLRSRGQVIGAMTVQSTRGAAFGEADIAAMQTMADQVAVAIDNARLFAEAQAALREMQATQQRYLGQAWTAYSSARTVSGYAQTVAGLTALEREVLPEVQRAIAAPQSPISTGARGEPGPLALVAPIVQHGQPVGALGVQPGDEGRPWTEEEITLVETLAEHFGLAADNIRLLDETQRRASREQMARQITDAIRSAVSVEDAVQRAIREMGRALDASEVVARLGTGQELLSGRGGDGHE